jgi:hypothetical protein
LEEEHRLEEEDLKKKSGCCVLLRVQAGVTSIDIPRRGMSPPIIRT